MVKKVTAGLLWVVCLIPLTCLAQKEKDNKVDTTYIQEYPDHIGLRVLGVVKGLDLSVSDIDRQSAYYYGPRYKPYVGFGGFFWNIAFNIIIPVAHPGEIGGRELRRLNLQGSLFSHRWLLSGIYQRYRGYYLTPLDSIQDFPEEQFHGQMLSTKLEGTVTYLPNGRRVSMRAPFNQSVRQKRSAGSFVLSTGFSYFALKDKEGVLPAALEVPEMGSLSSMTLSSINTKVGYVGTLVHRNFFLHLYGLAGVGFQIQNYTFADSYRNFNVVPAYDGRASLGYDNGKYFGGVYAIADYSTYRIEHLQFRELTTQIRFFIGLRLVQPDWLRKLKPAFLEKLQNSPTLPFPSIWE